MPAACACAAVRSEVGWDPQEAQALLMTPAERFDREGRRRAAAEPDDHAVLDQRDRGFRRRTLESVLLALGGRRAHDRTAAAALARMAEMAAA